ncbi:DNA helicase [Bosea sp. 125]|nr:DNA helicase [Bosea sp. 127]VXC93168.1 DNA helicase [Bosea sp. 125]
MPHLTNLRLCKIWRECLLILVYQIPIKIAARALLQDFLKGLRKMIPIVVTENALHILSSSALAPDWLVNFDDLISLRDIFIIARPEAIYIATHSCSPDTRILIIQRQKQGLFEGIDSRDRRSVFDRCARIAFRYFDSAVSLNPRWMPFHAGNKISIFAFGYGRSDRIAAEQGPLGSADVYVYGFGTDPKMQDLATYQPDLDVYKRAREGLPLALSAVPLSKKDFSEGSIDLSDVEPSSISQGFTYSDWYPLHLSKDQLRFVDNPLSGPLRLRGSAGTGKTLAMIIKALKTKYDADESGDPKRILFVTHSWAMAENVDRLISKMDIFPDSISDISVIPLLYLANNRDYSRIDREPLGIDSEDGKRLALREISSVIDEFVAGDWIAYRSGCTEDFVGLVEAAPGSTARKLFSWDLLVEFGCVLAAQGILTHAADRERYLRVRRLRWMMPLDNAAEKSAVFALWAMFMSALREKRWISSDQIISDYLNDLSTFFWEAARQKNGYDVVFVDEMHLFNAQERLIFHNLLRNAENPPTVIMALDPKQSPRETFTNISDERDNGSEGILERARLPNSEKIDLLQVYRYTPEIGRVIRSVHDAAPGLDFPEDWDVPQGSSSTESGDIPEFRTVDGKLQVYKLAITSALDLGKQAQQRKGRVAILCMDSDRFGEYLAATVTQYPEIVTISSRDDTEKLRYSGKRSILSTPEYVAGLQFDTVILIDANEDQVPEGKYRSYHFRRFLSELYLGLSRAERKLLIIASKDAGGITKTLKPAIDAGQLKEVK